MVFTLSKKHLTLLFFLTLIGDILLKNYDETSSYRLITKSLLILFLASYTLSNRAENKTRNVVYIILALFSFLVGDVLMLYYKDPTLYLFAIMAFICGKFFYVLRLATNKDFDMRRLIPYIFLIVFFMLVIFHLIYKNLNEIHVYLVFVYLLVAFKVFLFTLLRKDAVTVKSYNLVLLGVVFSIISDTIVALSSFSAVNIPFNGTATMLFYGLSQYFIIVGFFEDKNTCFFKEDCQLKDLAK